MSNLNKSEAVRRAISIARKELSAKIISDDYRVENSTNQLYRIRLHNGEMERLLSTFITGLDVTTSINFPFNSTWQHILNCISESSSIPSELISYIVIVDDNNVEFSPPLSSDIIFWKLMNIFDADTMLLRIHFDNKATIRYVKKIKYKTVPDDNMGNMQISDMHFGDVVNCDQSSDIDRNTHTILANEYTFNVIKERKSDDHAGNQRMPVTVTISRDDIWSTILTTIATRLQMAISPDEVMATASYLLLIDFDTKEKLCMAIRDIDSFWQSTKLVNDSRKSVYEIYFSPKAQPLQISYQNKSNLNIISNKTTYKIRFILSPQAQRHILDIQVQGQNLQVSIIDSIEMVESNIPNTIEINTDSSWNDICDYIKQQYTFNKCIQIKSVNLVDNEMSELFLPVSNEKSFWKLVTKNYLHNRGMMFMVHGYVDISEWNELKNSLNVTGSPSNVATTPLNVTNPPLNVATTPLNVTNPPLNVATTPLNVTNSSLNVATAPLNVVSAPLYEELEEVQIVPSAHKLSNIILPPVTDVILDTANSGQASTNRDCNEDDINEFNQACIVGDTSKCMILFKKFNIDLKKNPPNSLPRLHHAVLQDYITLLHWYVDNGADINDRDALGDIALATACRVSKLHLVKYLLEVGSNVNTSNEIGETPLMIAASLGSLEIVEHLNAHHVRIDQRDIHGRSAFLHASAHGNISIAKYLFNAGASLYARGGTVDQCDTALHHAARGGHYFMMEWLVREAKIDKGMVNEGGRTAERVYVESSYASSFEPKYYTMTDLEKAIKENDFLLAKIVLDILLRDYHAIDWQNGTTPLHYAAAAGDIDLAIYLAMSGFDINQQTDVGRSPLHYACYKGHLAMVKYLYSIGGNLHMVDRHGGNSLSIAQKGGFTNIALWIRKVLISDSISNYSSDMTHSVSVPLESNVASSPAMLRSDVSMELGYVLDLLECIIVGDIRYVSHNISQIKHIVRSPQVLPGYPSALHCAVLSGNIEVVQYILNIGAPIDYQCTASDPTADNSSKSWNQLHYAMMEHTHLITPLHLACDRIFIEAIFTIIRLGANPTLMGLDGFTPLHSICSQGLVDCLYEIYELYRGACFHLISNRKISLVHVSAAMGHVNILEFLVDACGVDVHLKDSDNANALHYSCDNGGFVNAAVWLIEKGVSHHEMDSCGRTPFMLACTSNLELAQYLYSISDPSDIYKRSVTGNTVLHMACATGQIDVVRWLVNFDTIPFDALNNEGETPLVLSNKHGHTELSHWIEHASHDEKASALQDFEHRSVFAIPKY